MVRPVRHILTRAWALPDVNGSRRGTASIMSQLGDTDVTRLSDHIAILRRQWRIPLVLMLLGGVVAAGLSVRQDTRYAAESRLLIEPTSTETTGRMDPTEVSTLAQLVDSARIAERVIEELELDVDTATLLDSVTVTTVEQTRVVAIAALRPTAQEAADVADSFARQYIAYQVETAGEVVFETRNRLIEERALVQEELSDVRSQLEGPRTRSWKAWRPGSTASWCGRRSSSPSSR